MGNYQFLAQTDIKVTTLSLSAFSQEGCQFGTNFMCVKLPVQPDILR